MAAITFFSDENGVQNLNGSGLGFYGSAFGTSVSVGSYNDSTFITNSAGTTQGAQVENNKWTATNSGSINGLTMVNLLRIPNSLATLNVRFTHGSSVQTQNAKLRIYDRSSINNPASGVTTKVAEIINTDNTQTTNGSGDTAWLTPAGSAIIVDLAPSPGMSGFYAGNGSNSTRSDTRHDWFTAISASPDSIGSKTLYGLYISLEYL